MGYAEAWLENDEIQWATEVLNAVLSAEAKGTEQELGRVESILGNLRAQHSSEPFLLNAEGRLADARDRLGDAWDWYRRAQRLTSPDIYASPWVNDARMYIGFRFLGKAMAICRYVLQSSPERSGEELAREYLAWCQERRASIAKEHGLSSEKVTSGDPFVLSTLEVLLALGLRVTGAKCRVEDHAGGRREVDILAEVTPLDFLDPLPIAIECKDWSRPVDRPAVDKCVSLITHSPYKLCIIVARAFTRGARQAATANGIWLLSSEELGESAERMLRARLSAGPVFTFQRLLIGAGAPMGTPVGDERFSAKEKQQRSDNTKRLIALLGASSNPPEVHIGREGISIEGETVVPCGWNRGLHLTRGLSSLGQLPLLAQLLLLGYAVRVERS